MSLLHGLTHTRSSTCPKTLSTRSSAFVSKICQILMTLAVVTYYIRLWIFLMSCFSVSALLFFYYCFFFDLNCIINSLITVIFLIHSCFFVFVFCFSLDKVIYWNFTNIIRSYLCNIKACCFCFFCFPMFHDFTLPIK